MKSLSILPLLALPLAAQDIAPMETERDPVLSALLDDQEELAKPLDASEDSDDDTTDAPGAEGSDDAVLVLGNPPESMLEEEPADAPSADDAPKAGESGEPKGVRVEVEPGSGADDVAAEDVRIVAPFPAKRLAPPPAGWKLVHPDDAPAMTESVTLDNGETVALSIRPHVLVPEADGAKVFDLRQPGFDAALGYDQEKTVGSVLADSIHQLDKQSSRLDDAARRLSELLDSLPASDASGEDAEPDANTVASEP